MSNTRKIINISAWFTNLLSQSNREKQQASVVIAFTNKLYRLRHNYFIELQNYLEPISTQKHSANEILIHRRDMLHILQFYDLSWSKLQIHHVNAMNRSMQPIPHWDVSRDLIRRENINVRIHMNISTSINPSTRWLKNEKMKGRLTYPLSQSLLAIIVLTLPIFPWQYARSGQSLAKWLISPHTK
jgi:hypothetical protein